MSKKVFVTHTVLLLCSLGLGLWVLSVVISTPEVVSQLRSLFAPASVYEQVDFVSSHIGEADTESVTRRAVLAAPSWLQVTESPWVGLETGTVLQKDPVTQKAFLQWNTPVAFVDVSKMFLGHPDTVCRYEDESSMTCDITSTDSELLFQSDSIVFSGSVVSPLTRQKFSVRRDNILPYAWKHTVGQTSLVTADASIRLCHASWEQWAGLRLTDASFAQYLSFCDESGIQRARLGDNRVLALSWSRAVYALMGSQVLFPWSESAQKESLSVFHFSGSTIVFASDGDEALRDAVLWTNSGSGLVATPFSHGVVMLPESFAPRAFGIQLADGQWRQWVNVPVSSVQKHASGLWVPPAVTHAGSVGVRYAAIALSDHNTASTLFLVPPQKHDVSFVARSRAFVFFRSLQGDVVSSQRVVFDERGGAVVETPENIGDFFWLEVQGITQKRESFTTRVFLQKKSENLKQNFVWWRTQPLVSDSWLLYDTGAGVQPVLVKKDKSITFSTDAVSKDWVLGRVSARSLGQLDLPRSLGSSTRLLSRCPLSFAAGSGRWILRGDDSFFQKSWLLVLQDLQVPRAIVFSLSGAEISLADTALADGEYTVFALAGGQVCQFAWMKHAPVTLAVTAPEHVSIGDTTDITIDIHNYQEKPVQATFGIEYTESGVTVQEPLSYRTLDPSSHWTEHRVLKDFDGKREYRVWVSDPSGLKLVRDFTVGVQPLAARVSPTLFDIIETWSGSLDPFFLPQGGVSLFPFAFDTSLDGSFFFLQNLPKLSPLVTASQWQLLAHSAIQSFARTDDKNEKVKYLALLFAADTYQQTVEDRRVWYRKNILTLIRQNRQMTDQAQRLFQSVVQGLRQQESSPYYQDLFAGYNAVLESQISTRSQETIGQSASLVSGTGSVETVVGTAFETSIVVVSDDQAFVEWQLPYGMEYVSSSMPLVSSQDSVVRFALPSGETTLTVRLLPRVVWVYTSPVWSLRSLQSGVAAARSTDTKQFIVRSE